MSRNRVLTGIFLCASVVLCSCQANERPTAPAAQPAAWSSDKKARARQEIAGRIDEIISGAEKLDVDAAIRPYLSDSSFRVVNPDASVADYQTMKTAQTEFFRSVKRLSFTTVREEFKFLANDLVMCTWTGRNEFELKTGEKMRIAPYVGSMLFSRKGGEWRIIYAHESSAQPVKVAYPQNGDKHR